MEAVHNKCTSWKHKMFIINNKIIQINMWIKGLCALKHITETGNYLECEEKDNFTPLMKLQNVMCALVQAVCFKRCENIYNHCLCNTFPRNVSSYITLGFMDKDVYHYLQYEKFGSTHPSRDCLNILWYIHMTM